MPPLFTCLWFTDPRGRVCHPHAASPASKFVAIEGGPDAPVWTLVVCPARHAPEGANPAQGNPNSMPKIGACSKSLRDRSAAPR